MFALRAGGIVVLGENETLGPAAADYEKIDPTSGIYRKLGNSTVAGRPGWTRES